MLYLNPMPSKPLSATLSESAPRLHRVIPTQIADALAIEIIDEDYAPGSRLNEVEIAARWAVSRSPVREALRILEKRGLVVIAPQRGARVTLLSENEIKELFEIREVLVGLAAKKAAEDIDDRAAEQLNQALQKLEACIGNPERYERASAAATLLMARLSGSSNLIEMISSFADRIGRYARLGLGSRSRRDASIARWRNTFELIQSGTGKGAEKASRQQSLENRDEALRVLRTRLNVRHISPHTRSLL
jgi:DNA-binding GntR family transcriptional regulator